MTLFWLLAAAITAATAALLIHPLRRPTAPPPPRTEWDLALYRDQLAEIERDRAHGALAAAEAEAARAEIGRRLLAATPPEPAAPPLPAATARRTRLALVIALPLLALPLYLALGRPDLPGHPFAEDAPSEAMPETVQAAIARLADHLKANPNDLEGWTLLARSEAKLGQPDDAVTAWRRAAALAPDDADLGADLAEALTQANQGVIPEEARTRFEKVQAARPDDPRAGYYLALARLQAGDERGALERWAKLVAASPANAPWLPMVRQRLAEVANHLHLDPAAITPQPRPAESSNAGADGDHKTIRDRAAILTERLKATPGDTVGWLHLIAAYESLGDTPARLDAARRASDLNPRNPDLQVARAEAILAATPATDDRLPPEAATALRAALTLAPDSPAALWYLALDAAATGHPTDARTLLERLLKQFDPREDEYRAVKARLEGVR